MENGSVLRHSDVLYLHFCRCDLVWDSYDFLCVNGYPLEDAFSAKDVLTKRFSLKSILVLEEEKVFLTEKGFNLVI